MRLATLLLQSFLCVVACSAVLAQPTAAQTWSLGRSRPSLFEIIAVDPVSEPRWPFGNEDLAGDGQVTTTDAEASVDLRSVYADARAGRLWLRAYVAARSASSSTTALTFFFVNTDQNVSTGGPAQGQELWPALTKDPSSSGYELALGVRADGTLLGLFQWDSQDKRWAAREKPAQVASAERGVARDPLRLLGDERAFAQVSVELALAKLDDSCRAQIFVRTWNDQPKELAYGDTINSFAVTCRAKLNAFGDPEPLRSDRCDGDASCPAGGRCQDGICLFSYECNSNAACKTEQRCSNNVCIHFKEGSCSSSEQCGGLICEQARCESCTETSERACADDGVCAPDGRCLLPSAAYSGNDDSIALASGERVQGGALSCSLTQAAGSAGTCLWLLLLPIAGRWTDRRLRRLRSKHGGAQ
jgi:hypothetical protein